MNVTPLSHAALRGRAEALAAPLPPLLARAERLAASVLPGGHGRRRAGVGETFWQFRPAVPGDPARSLDWRRSARSDGSYVRQTEWEAPQTVRLWCDASRAMEFSAGDRAPKSDRARLVSLALAVLLLRGGERVGLLGGDPPRSGRARAERLAMDLMAEADADYGEPPVITADRNTRTVLVSDFLGEAGATFALIRSAASVGAPGTVLQVLDPSEEAFPYEGRTLFESMAGAIRFDTRAAGALREDYRGRLAARREALRDACRKAGWTFRVHHTDAPPAAALRALWQDVAGAIA